MCIILDVNSFSNFRNRADEDMEIVRRWLENRNGKIAYSSTETLRGEWGASGGYGLMMELLYPGASSSSAVRMGWEQILMELDRLGTFKLVPAEDVQAKADALEQTGDLQSDDPDIIALAMLANAKVLVVQRIPDTPIRGRGRPRGADPELQEDFKNLVGGSVYITRSHRHLLTRDTCP